MAKGKIYLKTAEQIEIIRENGLILGQAHAEVAKLIEPGVSTASLDKVAEEFIRDHGGYPSFLNLYNFPASLCISVNEVVVHGLPSNRVLKSGDVISIDGGVFKNGYHADSAYTYAVGDISEENKLLLIETMNSLHAGLGMIRSGIRMGDLSFTIQKYVESKGYGVVRELVGHGIGKTLHEAPEVPNFGKRGNGPLLRKGMTLAVEPMVTRGKRFVVQESDGWTIRTEDRQPAAHYEHTIAVTNEGCDILTTFKYIEEVLKQKNYFLVS